MGGSGHGMRSEFSFSSVQQEEIRALIELDVGDQKAKYEPSEKLIDKISDVCVEAAKDHYDPILDEDDEQIDELVVQLEEQEDGGDFVLAVRDLLDALGYPAFRDENLVLRVQEVVWRLRSARKTA